MNILRAVLVMPLLLAFTVQAYAITFTDQASYITALAGLARVQDDFAAYPGGSLSNGQTLGVFGYSFDPALTLPGIASNGNGGQALGDTSSGTDPNNGTGVFVGGQSVTLTYQGAAPLVAFGAEFSYAPNFDFLPGDLYQLIIRDGNGAGTVAGNLPGLDPSGGTFFLGFIGDPFIMVSLQSSATDANGDPYLTPAYQVDQIFYSTSTTTPVPEPSALLLLILGITALFPLLRTRFKSER
jgi:hypothetical protein